MKRAMRVQAISKKVTLITTAFVLAVSTLTASLPFILSQNASAISGNSYSNITLNQAEWSVDRQVPSGGWSTDPANSRVLININQLGSSSTAFNKTEGVSAPVVSGTTSLTGSFYIAPDWASKQGLRVGLWGVTNTPTSWPIVEYAANVDGYTGWRIWDTVDGGWTNVSAPTNIGGSNTVEILVNPVTNTFSFYVNNVKVGTLNANGTSSFVQVILNHYNKGTGDTADNYTVDWRNLKAGKYPVTNACTTTSVVWSNTLTAWNSTPGLDDTRSAGHNVITSDGLRVYTDDATSNAKATGYRAVNYALSENGSQSIAASMDWTQTSGTLRPGLQLVVDFDNNGTSDGILVGEPSYGQNWWLSNGSSQFVKDNAPRTGGGNGSNWFGTLNDWLTVYPGARVKAVGYSLGSGVQADGIIKSLTLGCVTYKFDNVAPGVPVHVSPANNVVQASNNFWFDWSDVAGATRYELQNSTNPAVNPSTGSFQNVMWTGDYQNIQPTESKAQSVGASGTWYWQVRAIDAAGNASAWTSPWEVTIDVTAPGAPVLVTPDWYVANGATKTLDWNAPADADIAYYEYAEYVNTAPTSATTTPSWVKIINSPTTETTDTAWGSDVMIFWRVRAVDTVGNKGAWSETRTIVTDRTNPTSTNTLTSLVTKGTTTVTQHINDNYAPASGKLRIWKLNPGTTTPDTTKFFAIGNLPVDASGNVVYTFNSSNLFGDGSYIAKFTATDRAGNAIVTQTYFTLDATAPIISLDPLSASTNTPTFTGSITDPSAKVYLSIENGTPVEVTNNGVSWTYTVPTALDDGDYEIVVYAVDTAGNVSEPKSASLRVATVPVVNGRGTASDGTSDSTTTTSNLTPTVPTFPASFNSSQVLGTSTTEGNDDTEGTPEVKGTSTEKTLADAVGNTNGSALGLAWYWWLLIVAAVAVIVWWIVGAIRNRSEQA